MPTIEIADPDDGGAALRSAMAAPAAYDWLVVSPRPTVPAGHCDALRDARDLAGVRLAAVGPGTADGAGRAPPAWSTSCPSASSPRRCSRPSPIRPPTVAACCSPGPRSAREVLPDGLRAVGWQVDVVDVYRTVPGRARRRRTRAGCGGADAITFTSASSVDQLRGGRRRRARCPPSWRASARSPHAAAHGAAGARSTVEADRAHPRRPGRGRWSTAPATGADARGVVALGRRAASPNTDSAGCAAPRRCADWSPRPGSSVDDLIAPLFVREGIDEPQPDQLAARRGAAHPGVAARRGRRARRPRASRRSSCSACPSTRTPRAREPRTPTASCRSRSRTCATPSATASC